MWMALTIAAVTLTGTGSTLAPPSTSGQAPGSGTPVTLASTIEPWWGMIQQSFVSAAEAMPADKYEFAPKEGAFTAARTFAQQVKHVACANYAFFNEIEGTSPPDACETGGPDPARTKDELVTYLRSSFEYGRKVLTQLTPANALDPADGRYGGPSTRLGITTLAIWHASDHYGQIVIYLRMNGIVPPASR